jgi:hypothetical protein
MFSDQSFLQIDPNLCNHIGIERETSSRRGMSVFIKFPFDARRFREKVNKRDREGLTLSIAAT